MNYIVKIDGQIFEVQIENLRSRPIIAHVDGEELEVWPESSDENSAPRAYLPRQGAFTSPVSTSTPTAGGFNPSVVRAPIPGNIVAVHVKAGDQVTVGQAFCTLDAMKMHNTIRSGRIGVIAAVHVTVGSVVKHNDLLLEFTD